MGAAQKCVGRIHGRTSNGREDCCVRGGPHGGDNEQAQDGLPQLCAAAEAFAQSPDVCGSDT